MGVLGSPAGSRAAQEALDRAIATARYADTSGLESAMKMARKKGVNTRAAEARLHELQDEKRRKDRVRAALEEALLNARLGMIHLLNSLSTHPVNSSSQVTTSTYQNYIPSSLPILQPSDYLPTHPPSPSPSSSIPPTRRSCWIRGSYGLCDERGFGRH